MADWRVRVIFDFRRKHQWAEVKCGRCGWRVVFPHDSIEALFPRPTTVDRAEKRFRCRRCGTRGAEIRGVGWRDYHG